eukprot:TRINITY_DN1558_c0_g1_i8.p1 TRINITY_DN1558_c0_g1~~TRINITY_DN1558_c0_g1_i8.p1  ORF type:complete len:335 (-),score=81.30 TRINITY_DN1558_c0_g1_i8:118-1122(-)
MKAFFALATLMLVMASAAPTDSTRVKEFLFGLAKGLGLPVDYNYLEAQNFVSSDIDSPVFFARLRSLGQIDLNKFSTAAPIIQSLYDSIVFLKFQRPSGLGNSYNLSRAVNATETALRNGALFLNQVVNKGKQSELKDIGLLVPDQMVFVGSKLGSLILEVEISFVSFLLGLGEGLNQKIDSQVFILNNFNYDQDTVQDIYNVLALLNQTSLPLRFRVEAAINQLDYKFMMVRQNQSAVISKDTGLMNIFNTILPRVFNGPNDCLQIVEKNNLLDMFPAIGESARYNLRQTGLRLGTVFRYIYAKQNPQVSLMEAPVPTRRASFLRKLLIRKSQ